MKFFAIFLLQKGFYIAIKVLFDNCSINEAGFKATRQIND